MKKKNVFSKPYINNQFLEMGFNRQGRFIGVNIASAYHTIIKTPYYNPRTRGPKGEIYAFAYFVLNGSIKFLVDEKEIVVNENHVFFGLTTPNIVMTDNGNPAEFYSFYFTVYSYNLPLYTPFPIPKREKEKNCMKKILKYLNEQNDLNIGSVNAIFSDLLFNWLRRCKEHSSSQLPYNSLMLDAQLYINEHIEEPIRVAELAERFNFSEQYFRKLFTQVIGSSPKQYIENTKLQRAFTLLKETTLTISEISDKLNYSSCHHFANSFKKVYNVSPSECRHSTV